MFMYMYIYMFLYIYVYVFICLCMYIYMLTPTRAYLFSYYIDCFIARSTICYLLSAKKNKKQCIGEPSPLPHPKVGLPKLCFFCVCFFLFLVSLPFQSPTQNKSSKMCVCLFFLVWGRAGELIFFKKIYASLFGWFKHSKFDLH